MIIVDGTASSVENDGKVTVICAVLQKYRRELRVKGLDTLPIGFAIFSVPDGQQHMAYGGKLRREFFEHTKAAAKSQSFVDLREVVFFVGKFDKTGLLEFLDLAQKLMKQFFCFHQHQGVI